MALATTLLGCASLVCSGLYGMIWTHRPQSLTRTIVKAIPVSALALISALAGGPVWLTVALALGAVGDVFLSRGGQNCFLGGLVAFLLGHIAYVILLTGLGNSWAQFAQQGWRIAAVLALVIVAGIVVRRLLPHLGALRGPVLAYVCVILGMGFAALALPGSWPLVLATVGALLFIASDAILGFEVFVFAATDHRRRWTGPLLWFLYWGGQSIIALAVLLDG